MLTSDLAMNWQRGGKVGPRYIDTDDPKHFQEARDLIGVFTEHEGQTRAALEGTLQEYVGTGTDYRILRGFIKLLTDRCTFEVGSTADPAEARRALFFRASRHHPVGGAGAARDEIVADAARELNCAPEDVMPSLYADLPENQKLIEFESLKERELLDLYNVAQAQALLYRCVQMHLTVEPQSAEGYRELFNSIKAYRLIHTIKGNPARGYEVRLDGPVSMFHRSQKYGIQMAVFLPALLLCDGWRMRAEVALKPGGGGGSAFFEMDSTQHRLRSHYLSAAPYENPTLAKLAERWESHDSPWSLEPSSKVIDLGDSAFIPDFVLRHADGQEVYLEVLGFWTPRHLQGRLKEFEHGGVKNFIIAAWDELRGSRDPLPKIPQHTIVFKKNLDPAMVEAAINKMSEEERAEARP